LRTFFLGWGVCACECFNSTEEGVGNHKDLLPTPGNALFFLDYDKGGLQSRNCVVSCIVFVVRLRRPKLEVGMDGIIEAIIGPNNCRACLILSPTSAGAIVPSRFVRRCIVYSRDFCVFCLPSQSLRQPVHGPFPMPLSPWVPKEKTQEPRSRIRISPTPSLTE